ncbi:DUF3152 domain-containing protein [Rhodococcus rhodnii]|uniref:DUF3152 domain-containing protein n=2 Tax=Rhodococcus rhodnii TaxID=38312 RepID=R7WJ84_9NOCA|nr:hypothetical protein Rrhod_3134 [Rhodococcus rhodnii LMG 5362]TXG92598.1 DUF3152 domain-containing protein [Rhodococcus rhodnii]
MRGGAGTGLHEGPYERDPYARGSRDPAPYGDGTRQPLRARWDPTAPDTQRASRRPTRNVRKQTRLGRFVSTYGWRAYAIPVLAVVTMLVVADAVRGQPDVVAGPDAGITQEAEPALDPGTPPAADGDFAASLPSGVLPDGGPFTERGAGTWRVVPGTTERIGQGTEREFTYTVEIEDGVDTSGFGGDDSVARMVDQTLANPKSWIGDERFAFSRVDTGEPDFRVSLTSHLTVRDTCGYAIPLETSCYDPDISRVVLNEARWVRGAVAFQGDIGSYRQYLVNHEIGHAIGYAAHQPCETQDGLAPIMMQQSFGTANDAIADLDPGGVVPRDGLVCRFNPWPYPRA